MRYSVVNNESLHHLGEGTGDAVRPQKSSTVDSSSHEEVTQTHGADYIAPSWSINHYGKGRALVRSVYFLVTGRRPQTPDAGEETE